MEAGWGWVYKTDAERRAGKDGGGGGDAMRRGL